MKELTNKEKAELIVNNGFSKRSLSTLKGLTKEELEWIIENERDPEKDEFNRQENEETKELIENIIEILEGVKKEREGKEIAPFLKNFIKKNVSSLNFLNGRIKGYIGIGLTIAVGAVILIDGLVGFSKIQEKIKAWQSKKQTKLPR